MTRLKKVFIWSSVVLFSLLINGCKSSSKIITKANKVYDVSSAYNMATKNRVINYSEIKYSLKYEGDKNYNLTGIIKSYSDSLFWINIVSKTMGIEVFRAQLTADSLQFIDKMNKRYYNGKYDYLNKLLGFNLNYNFITSLFKGSPAGVDFVCSDSTFERFKTKAIDGNFVYSYSMPTAIDSLYLKLKQPFISYNFKVNSSGNLVEGVYLDSKTGKSMKVFYSEYDENNNLNSFQITINNEGKEHNIFYNVINRSNKVSQAKYSVPSSYIPL